MDGEASGRRVEDKVTKGQNVAFEKGNCEKGWVQMWENKGTQSPRTVPQWTEEVSPTQSGPTGSAPGTAEAGAGGAGCVLCRGESGLVSPDA